MLGGPQAQYSAPQTFFEVGLHGAGYDVTGVTIPGTVAVEIGAGAGHAWSITSGGTDNSDWYADTIDPAAHPGQYLFNGRWHHYACRTETIDVYHQPARHYRVCQGRHGPVYAASGHTALALRDAGAEGIDGTVAGFLALDTAHNLAQFGDALPRFAGSFNFLYADQAGNIAYWQVGHVPLRAPGDNPFLIHPGTGSDEWRGYLPWPAMPHAINPAQGWLANWNNKPEPGWPNSAHGFIDWGPVQRVQALTRQLTALRPHTATAAALEHINRVAAQTAESPVGNEYNIAVHALLPRLLARVNTTADPRLPAAVALLSHWDGQRIDPDHDGFYHSPAVASGSSGTPSLSAAPSRPRWGRSTTPSSPTWPSGCWKAQPRPCRCTTTTCTADPSAPSRPRLSSRPSTRSPPGTTLPTPLDGCSRTATPPGSRSAKVRFPPLHG